MPTPQQIADYEIVGLIGESAHGSFYVARAPARVAAGARLVAVKVLAVQHGADAFRRITRELRVFASVPSPYLVTLHDAGRDGDTFYYAMEYFERGSLGAPSHAPRREELLAATADAARAAHALHEAGVAHRGIKPTKVLLTREGGGRLSNLGVAQVLGPAQTVTTVVGLGSLEYTDPRILHGEPASRAGDIWSIGATLHRVLTGESLYGRIPADGVDVTLRTVLERPARVADSLRPGEVELLTSCLDPDPASRPSTALEVAERIETLI